MVDGIMNKSLKAAAERQRKANNQKIEEAFTLLLEMQEISNRSEAQLLEGTITIMLQEVYEKRLNCLRPLEDVLFKMQKVVKAYNEQNYGEAYELKQKFEQTERPEAVEIINEIIGGLNNG